jgi:hypothetical protein
MRAFLLGAGATLVLAAAAFVYLGVREGSFDFDDIHAALPRMIGPPQPMRAIYLERRPLTLTGGTDDSSHNVSSIVALHKKPVATPGFKGSQKAWSQFVDCMRKMYAPFDVEIVEERPAQPGYILVAVGGTPDMVGQPKRTSGLAPFNSLPIEHAVVFVFSRVLKDNPVTMCETAAMEIAHAYGLDHEFLCKDPMTYLPPCGPKSFQNQEVRCGEKRARDCANGKPTQNSYALLLDVLGPAPTVTARREK